MNPLLHIRKKVFALTQAELAAIAKVSQGTVSKWESGELEPDRLDMSRIRRAAARRGLRWNDRWFFEHPETD